VVVAVLPAEAPGGAVAEALPLHGIDELRIAQSMFIEAALAGAAPSTPIAATRLTARPAAPPRRTSVILVAVTGVLPPRERLHQTPGPAPPRVRIVPPDGTPFYSGEQ
jgi:hypothetical protein